VSRDQGNRSGAQNGVSHVRRRLPAILDTMSAALCAYDTDWRIVYLNPQAEIFLGKMADELVGRVVWEVYPEARGSLVWEQYHRAQETQEALRFEEYSPDIGRCFEQHLFPSPEGLTVWARDITEEQAERARRAQQITDSERRFRALIENSTDGVLTVSATGTILYASPSCARIDGRPTEERIGGNILDTVHPDEVAEIGAQFAQLLSAPGAQVSGQNRFRHADGSWIWIEAIGQNLLHEPAIGAIVINFRDVTQRRVAAERYATARRELEQSERYYRALIDNGTDLISVIDAHGKLLYASPSHARILGWAPEELIGRVAFDLIHPDDRARIVQAFVDATASGAAGGSGVFRFRHHDGGWRQIEAIGQPPAPEYGLEGFVFNARDVTERASAEQRTQVLLEVARDIGRTLDGDALLASVQEHIRRVVPCDAVATFRCEAHGGIFRLAAHTGLPAALLETYAGLDMPAGAFTGGHLDTGTLLVNDVAAFTWTRTVPEPGARVRALMASPIRVRGRHVLTMVAMRLADPQPFTENDRALLTGINEQLALALERVDLHRVELEEARIASSLARMGQELLASFDTPVLLDRLCHVTTEVLECGASHTLLRRAEDGAYVPVAAHGMGARAWEALRELELPRDAVRALLQRLGGETLHQFVASSSDSGIVALLGLEPGTPVLCLALRRGEEIVGFQTAAMPNSGKPFSIMQLRIAQGIAHLASMALEHARINDQLGHANNLKSEFVAMMSHELRTPLNPIIGYGDLLLDGAFGTLNDEQSDVLRRMQRSSHNLLKLINEVLDLSRLEGGRVTLDLGELALSPLLDEIDAETVELRRTSGVALRFDVDPSLPRLWTDATKLKVVLKNLVVNALKFTARGSVTIVARDDGGDVVIDVRDTGSGIPPESLELIFEPFRQAESALVRQQGGVGLGLYIVSRLLELIGGTITVDSRVGVGSTFQVRLPDCAVAGDGFRASEVIDLTSGDASAAVIRRDGTIVAVNAAWQRLREEQGRPHGTDVGASYFAACASARGPEAITALEARVGIQSVAEGTRERFALEYPLATPGGERWFLMTAIPHPGHPGEVLIVHGDVTEHHRMDQIAARHLPNDPLTGLPNQQLFCGHLEQALDRARRAQVQVGLLYVDLDHFKRVNEKLGRAVGDQVLRLTARRLEEVLRTHEIVARPGDDEFLILAPSLSGGTALFDVATRVLSVFALPFNVESKAVQLQATIGLALAPDDASDAETLLQRADIALSEAKRVSRGSAIRRPAEPVASDAAARPPLPVDEPS
jgi:diguanylate cyclase (GGDEF)-like protein/PAS domain S-box-containing protein